MKLDERQRACVHAETASRGINVPPGIPVARTGCQWEHGGKAEAGRAVAEAAVWCE